MGLIICKEILRSSNGTIDVSSDGDDLGATFAIQMEMHLPKPERVRPISNQNISVILQEDSEVD